MDDCNPNEYVWSRRLDQPQPSESLHMFARPGFFETIPLLPIATRVHAYKARRSQMGGCQYLISMG